MTEYVYKERTERNLPHWHPPGATLFVTFRLAETVPQSELRLYRAQKIWLEEETRRVLKLNDGTPEIETHERRLIEFRRRWFVKFEEILHQAKTGPMWLKNEQIASIVAEALHHRDGNVYRLDAYCIMSNHVHAVFSPFLSAAELREVWLPQGLRFLSKDPPLDKIMQSLKGWTAWSCNRVLGRKGPFWEQESYDHAVRDASELERVMTYTLNNPVKAGLVSDWHEWKWSYQRETVP